MLLLLTLRVILKFRHFGHKFPQHFLKAFPVMDVIKITFQYQFISYLVQRLKYKLYIFQGSIRRFLYYFKSLVLIPSLRLLWTEFGHNWEFHTNLSRTWSNGWNISFIFFRAQYVVFCTILTLLTIGSTRTYSPLGGAIWPPSQKIPGTCPLGLKHGRVSKGGLNITLKPKKSHL